MRIYIKSLFILALIYIAASLSSCNDDPANIPLVTDSLEISGVSTSDFQLVTGVNTVDTELNSQFNSRYLFAGKWDDFSAFSLLRYSNIPSNLDTLEESDISSVKLYIYSGNYAFGDLESMNFSVDIHNLVAPFSADSKWDDIFDESGNTNHKGEFLAKASKVIDLEIDTSFIEVDLPSSFIIDWLKFRAEQQEYLDYLNENSVNRTDTTKLISIITDTLQLNLFDLDKAKYYYGLGIFFNQESDIIYRMDNITPLGSEGRNPYISVEYETTVLIEDVATSTFTNFEIPAALAGFFSDGPEPKEDDFHVQASLSHRAEMMFDFSMIPEGSPIHSAELELFIDRENSIFGSDGLDSIFAGNVLNEIDELRINWPYYGVFVDSTESYFVQSITSAVERFSNGNTLPENQKIILASQNLPTQLEEFYYFDRLAFFGPDAEDPSKRPILKIIYSKWPEP